MALPFSLPMPYRFDLKSALVFWKFRLHTLIHTFPLEILPPYLWSNWKTIHFSKNTAEIRHLFFVGIGFAFLPKKKLEVRHVLCRLLCGPSTWLSGRSKHDFQEARPIILDR